MFRVRRIAFAAVARAVIGKTMANKTMARAMVLARPGAGWVANMAMMMVAGMSVSAAGCTEPSVDALAVWVEEADASGRTHLQIYEAGARWSVPIEPDVPGVGPEFLAVGVANDGATVALASEERLTIEDLETRQRTSVAARTFGLGSFASEFYFTRSSSGILRPAEFVPDVFAYVPLREFGRLSPALLPIIDPPANGREWRIRTASAAPVLFWFEGLAERRRVDGRVYAVQLPGSDVGGLAPVEVPTTRAQLLGLRGRDESESLLTSWCTDGLCAAPDGTAISITHERPCTLTRWSWVGDPVLEVLSLPPACPRQRDPSLIAQIGRDTFVLHDSDRVYLADTEHDRWDSRPKPSGSTPALRMADDGRVVVLVWPDGPLVRVDEAGVRLVNAESSACRTEVTNPIVSPHGTWVVQACPGGGEFAPDREQAFILRSSALGLEQHLGIAMRPLAVDEEGNVLLYSYDVGSASLEPRGLFVLASSGQLARIDDLEPQPTVITESGIAQSWFAATAID